MNDQSHEQRNGSSENRPQPLYVTLILDETGSMQDCKGAAIAGFNHYVARHCYGSRPRRVSRCPLLP